MKVECQTESQLLSAGPLVPHRTQRMFFLSGSLAASHLSRVPAPHRGTVARPKGRRCQPAGLFAQAWRQRGKPLCPWLSGSDVGPRSHCVHPSALYGHCMTGDAFPCSQHLSSVWHGTEAQRGCTVDPGPSAVVAELDGGPMTEEQWVIIAISQRIPPAPHSQPGTLYPVCDSPASTRDTSAPILYTKQ